MNYNDAMNVTGMKGEESNEKMFDKINEKIISGNINLAIYIKILDYYYITKIQFIFLRN